MIINWHVMRMNVSRVYSVTKSSHSGPGKHSTVFTEAPDSMREWGCFFFTDHAWWTNICLQKMCKPKTKKKSLISYAHIYIYIYRYMYISAIPPRKTIWLHLFFYFVWFSLKKECFFLEVLHDISSACGSGSIGSSINISINSRRSSSSII